MVEASVYGSKKYFLPAGTHFRGMGLSLLLLRVVQMYQACCGGPPNLFIQLKVSSHLYTYLNNRGFKEVLKYDETHDTESNNLTLAFEAFQEEIDMDRDRGCVLREAREGYVTLGLMKVAYLNNNDGRWRCPVINSWENYYTENKKWPDNVTMFHFPFQTDGRYIDQCAKGLLCLGTPFYYARDPTSLNACRKVNPMLQHIIMDGKHYEDLNSKTLELSTKWLTSEHIQFAINWIFRDEYNPVLKQFHVIPLDIVATVMTFMNERAGNGELIGELLHNYCMANWRALDSKMIFYVTNIAEQHWVLQVAVNPSEMISKVTRYKFPEEHEGLLYGYMYIDPFEQNYRDGTIPEDKLDGVRIPLDDPTANRELIFVLNYLSYYRDIHLHKRQDFYSYDKQLERIWAIGCKGPFGRVFFHDERNLYDAYISAQPRYKFPQLKAPLGTFPLQQDSYNCGVYVLMSLMDFVLTQWSNIWVTDNKFYDNVHNNSVFRLNAACKLGAAFVENPKDEIGLHYSWIAQLIRCELVMLME